MHFLCLWHSPYSFENIQCVGCGFVLLNILKYVLGDGLLGKMLVMQVGRLIEIPRTHTASTDVAAYLQFSIWEVELEYS